MPKIAIQPDDRDLKTYYKTMADLRRQRVRHEGGTRHGFADLLRKIARRRKWRLVEEYTKAVQLGQRYIRLDGALVSEWNRPQGYWEAKDSSDNLDAEIDKKIAAGYPLDNTIFEDTRRAALYQGGLRVRETLISNKRAFADLLAQFLNYKLDDAGDFDEVIRSYSEDIRHIAATLKTKIDRAHRENADFQARFADFMALCRRALNPNISSEAVDEMLIQHLMTERIIRRVFDVEYFTTVNIIAAEIEKVIQALAGKYFIRRDFYEELGQFHDVVERAAVGLDFHDKQKFINTVYERFFQGYSVRVADTHGIVYTPQEIVDFMCAAVEEALASEFGKKLGDEGVILIDPATGTGNFVVNLLRRAFDRNPRHFEDFYRHRLFANEVMLMPYYIASLNIEHQYYELTDAARPFSGLCFVDTLDLGDKKQAVLFMTEENTKRVERQQAADINVIIGNPPYNVGQINENDNNKNRKYDVIEKRIRETYAKDSKATLKNQLYDAYVKFFRWAVDRLEDRDGIVCYVTNNSFVDARAFDGFRGHLLQDFDRVYHLDLGGNIRKNQSGGPIGNVFNIRVGVGITLAIRSAKRKDSKLFYYCVPNSWTRAEKLDFLREYDPKDVEWHRLWPNHKKTWLVSATEEEFESHIPIGSKMAKASKIINTQTIFKTYCPGVLTSRDATVYDFEYGLLAKRIREFAEDYNAEVDRYKRQAPKPDNIDDFVNYDKIDWSATLKQSLKRGHHAHYRSEEIRNSLYRPFTKKSLYFAKPFVDRPGKFKNYFPNEQAESENRVFVFASVGIEKPFYSIIADSVPNLAFVGFGGACQSFPFYTYDADGSNRQENITDWALARFREHYGDPSISKWDIFYYVYALLHHPRYRDRYAADLKRQLPRIPFARRFRAFSQAGKTLAGLHLDYETSERYELDWQAPKKPISYRIDKMLPQNKRKSEVGYTVYDRLKVNGSLTLRGIPERAFAYRLGNRSALDWIVDQYRVKTDKRSGIVHDPNGYSDDERYIVQLVERVVGVSLQTVEIVDELAKIPFLEAAR